MLWAILSDVHGNSDALERVVEDARRRGARQFINLGDLGNGTAHEILSRVPVRSVLGNWEVSSWRLLPSPWKESVRVWPFQRQEGDALFCHASPVWPEQVRTLEDAFRYVQAQGSWFALFPSLEHESEALWEAFAEMESRRVRVCFHGHTHVQKVWVLTSDNRLRQWKESRIPLERDGSLYIVGVGSVGRPLDGSGPRYVLWDDESEIVTLVRL